MKKVFIAGFVALLSMVGFAGIASAGLITGYLYDSEAFAIVGSETRHQAAQDLLQDFAANNGNYTADDVFQVDIINFNSELYPGTTYESFLKADGNNGLTGLDATWGALNMSTAGGGYIAAMMKFEGTANFDANFSIRHDDGFILKLLDTNQIFDGSFPTSPATTNMVTTAGVHSFELYYQAYNGFPEVLTTSGVAHVPEPAAMLVFGTGLIGLIGVARKKKK